MRRVVTDALNEGRSLNPGDTHALQVPLGQGLDRSTKAGV